MSRDLNYPENKGKQIDDEFPIRPCLGVMRLKERARKVNEEYIRDN